MVTSAATYFADRHFVLLYCGYVMVAVFGYAMPFVHLPEYCLLHGLTSSDSQLLLSMIGLASAVGRISIGYVADKFGKLLMLRVCMIVAGTITLGWLAFTTFNLLMLFCVIFGFFGGGLLHVAGALGVCGAVWHRARRLGHRLGLHQHDVRLLVVHARGWLALHPPELLPDPNQRGGLVHDSRQRVHRLHVGSPASHSSEVAHRHAAPQHEYIRRNSETDHVLHLNVSLTHVLRLHGCLQVVRLRAPTMVDDLSSSIHQQSYYGDLTPSYKSPEMDELHHNPVAMPVATTDDSKAV